MALAKNEKASRESSREALRNKILRLDRREKGLEVGGHSGAHHDFVVRNIQDLDFFGAGAF